MPNFFLLALEVQLFESLFSLSWLRLYPRTKDRQSNNLLEIHISFRINLDLEVVESLLFLLRKLINVDYFPDWFRLSPFLVGWHFNLFRNQKVAFSLRLLGLWSGYLFLLDALISDLVVDDLDGSLEDQSQLQYSRFVVMDLVELKDKRLTDLVDAQVVPLTPSSIVSQFFLSIFAVNCLDFLELLHKLEINSTDTTC